MLCFHFHSVSIFKYPFSVIFRLMGCLDTFFSFQTCKNILDLLLICSLILLFSECDISFWIFYMTSQSCSSGKHKTAKIQCSSHNEILILKGISSYPHPNCVLKNSPPDQDVYVLISPQGQLMSTSLYGSPQWFAIHVLYLNSTSGSEMIINNEQWHNPKFSNLT